MRPCAAFRILAALLVGRSYALRVRQPPTLSRRAFTAAAGASLLCLRPLESTASGAVAGSDQQSRLVWEPRSEMPRRTGSTRYRKAFVAYLARFLLNFDSGSAEWWADQAKGFEYRGIDRDSLRSLRQKEFGQFSESVEVGLQRFSGKEGPRELFSLLRSRYGKSRAGKYQIALLFSLLEAPLQPSDLIRRTLGDADNATIDTLTLISDGRGYYPGGPPLVSITASDGTGVPAQARAVLQSTGALIGLRLVAGGKGYSYENALAPAVSISPPARGGQAAQAVAEMSGGRVVALRLTSAGSGYAEGEAPAVVIDSPRDSFDVPKWDATGAEAEVVFEQRVARVELIDGGANYRVDQPLEVTIAPPAAEFRFGAAAAAASAVAHLSPGGSTDARFARLSDAPPFLYLQPPGSISEELLRLLPTSLRPTELLTSGSFALDLSLLGPASGGRITTWAEETTGLANPEGSTLGNLPLPFGGAPLPFGGAPLPFGGAAREQQPFGAVGSAPVQREVQLGLRDYLSFAGAGAVCTATVRTLLSPLDVTKTVMQSSPESFGGLLPTGKALLERGGVGRLFTAADVTLLAGGVLGACGFGGNEFLRRYLTGLGGPNALELYPLQISVLAALFAQLVSATAVAPLELLRLRAVGATIQAVQPGAESGAGLAAAAEAEARWTLTRGLRELWAEGGLALLYSSLLPLLLRELPFTVTKFIVFDAATQAIIAAVPSAQESVASAAAVALVAGAAAGVAGAIVTNPADTLLTLSAQTPQAAQQPAAAKARRGQRATGSSVAAVEAAGAPPSLLDTAVKIAREDPASLFRGLLPRCLFFGALIAGQFLLYDYFKGAFRVSNNDLLLVLDVFADRLSFND